MSAWKLVEAVAEQEGKTEAVSPSREESSSSNHRSSSSNSHPRSSSSSGRGSGRGRGGRSSDGSSRGRGRSSNHSSSSPNASPTSPKYPGPYRSKADRSYFAYLAVQQIDSIFNPDSLCIDTFVRSYMDEAGYVPLSLLCSYENVAQYQCTYNDILNKMKETVSKCKYLEMDETNETVRPKTGWEKYVMPNAYGGRGLPRYIKQPKTSSNKDHSSADKNNTSADETTVTAEGGEDSTATTAAAVDPAHYAYWMSQVAAYGGYYPPELAYAAGGADPNYYYDPTTMAYMYNGTFYPTYPTVDATAGATTAATGEEVTGTEVAEVTKEVEVKEEA